MADPAARVWPALDLTRRIESEVGDDVAFGDRLALLLDDLGPVAVEDDDRRRHWRIHFDRADTRDHAVTALRATLGHVADIVPVDVEDEGWAVRVQQQLRAVQVGRVVVAPPWDVPTGAAVLVLVEPSMGFGTGHHQSTRLCLQALQALPLDGARVVDVGTGSGVLALAAARLGARDVVALDHDADAVTAARENGTRNQLSDLVQVRHFDLDAQDQESVAPGDVVFANLTAWVLRRHAEAILGLVAPRGTLVVSGFTHDQVPLVTDSFSGLSVLARYDEDDWVALVLGRSQA